MREYLAPETQGHVLISCDSSLGSSVAVCAQGRVFERWSDDARGHAEVLAQLMAEVLKDAQVSPSGVTGVVYGVGPGPFTGLRVGIAAARAYALGANVPAFALVSHEAVALEVITEGQRDEIRVVQDAKRRELFVTDYGPLDAAGIPTVIGGPRIETRAEYHPVEHEQWPERVPAGRLVQLAARRLASGRAFADPQALYLRQPDVKPPAAVKRVSS